MTYLIEMEDVLCELNAEIINGCELGGSINSRGEPEGITPKKIEAYLSNQPAEFWENLRPTGEFSELKQALAGKRIKVVTKPYNLGASQDGKKKWLEQHFPESELVFTRSKHVFANPSCVLIDCRPAAIQAFRRFGGKGILVGKPWNKGKEKNLAEAISEIES